MTNDRGAVEPKIILIDIETCPHEVLCFGNKWEPKVIKYNKFSSILSFGWKELGGETKVIATWDYNPKNVRDDRRLCQEIRKVLSSADIVIAHNGRAFDLRTINSRFAHNDVKPTTFKQIDTLLMARNCFEFPSNSLDDLAGYLGLGGKLPHTGKDLWIGCLKGIRKDQKMMKRYNGHDVDLLELTYLRLRPFATNHPRLDYYTRREECPTCQSPNIKRNGFSYLATGKRQIMECQSCGTHFKTGKLLKAA